MQNPGNLLGGGRNQRMTRSEQSGDRRVFKETDVSKGKILKRLWRYLGKSRWLIVLALFLVVASNVCALFGPKLSGRVIDLLAAGQGKIDFERVFYYVGWMVAFYLVAGILSYLLSLVVLRLSKRVVYQMRKDVFERLAILPVSFFDRHQAGDMISVISYDIDTVNQSIAEDLLQIVQSVLTVSASLVMMLTIEPLLVSVFAVTIPLSILLTRFITRRARPLFRARSAKLGELNGFVEEMLEGQKTTKAYDREEAVIRRFEQKNQQAVQAYTKAEYFGRMTGPSVNFINNVSLALISVFGALMYLKGRIGLGDISSFIQYSRKFSGPINEVANISGELQSAFAAAERVFRLMDEAPEPEDIPQAKVLSSVEGKVTAEDVCFGYIPQKPILRHFDLRANPGEMVAIVGPTGAGKTTIINLLMRFYDVDSGRICIDGNDIYQVTRESLRRAYTMVLQDTWLFHGTIFENIAYGSEGVTMEEVVQAAKAAKIHGYISKLPKGYQTVLSDNGVNISKGQKQLLTIARAMLLDSKMLILDEATSNVDTRTEQQIQEAMRQLMQDKTCFVIAHRLSTIRHADHILVVRDGNIVEQGTHEELMEKNGFYADLYYAQFETT
jgi:ATP-binding cassette subfamily B multidrug efflux pump